MAGVRLGSGTDELINSIHDFKVFIPNLTRSG